MGGSIVWEAVDFYVEKFGVVDVEQFVDDLITIREVMRELHG